MKILVLNGPNINMLGIREPNLYGNENLESLQNYCISEGKALGIEVDCVQSNYEGEICEFIQKAYGVYNGIIINPGAYTHTSVAILDAVKAVQLPTVEVHISDVSKREDFRQISYIRQACIKTIAGHGFEGYLEAMEFLTQRQNL